ncbi:MAG TPA: protein kinase [Candidatus Limnocylindrales bacterium]|nr:protein kinase [Candidatus Limnocylindrales bacterium]
MAKTVLFGRYRLEEPLGTGGSAQVWRATDTKTRDTVAVKRLHPVVFADEAGRERLLREFRALRDLDEPHVVRVRDLELTKDDGALILDYVAGPSLATRLAQGPRLSTGEAVAIALDVAAALAAAHAAGIVHRDVTPGNVLLDPDDGARLTDFGIALGGAGTDGEPVLTATGELVGTLRYVAPEQLRGSPATTASDVHALAAVTYEMLAGRPAYEAATPVALAEAHGRSIEPIPSIPPALDEVVRRGLAGDPADRPADAAAFAAEIQAAIAADRTEPIIANAPIAAPGTALASPGAAVEGEPEPLPASAGGPLWTATGGAVAAGGAASVAVPGAVAPRRAGTDRRAPAWIAALLGLAIAVFAFAALAPSLGSRPAAVPRVSEPAGVPAESVAPPSAEPTPPPDENANNQGGNDDAKAKGKGKGKGKGKDH